jgi:hypothetical protein
MSDGLKRARATRRKPAKSELKAAPHARSMTRLLVSCQCANCKSARSALAEKIIKALNREARPFYDREVYWVQFSKETIRRVIQESESRKK